MFDPKKLGEEADQLIQELNQGKYEVQKDVPLPEEQGSAKDTDGEAIAESEEVVEATTYDQGVDQVSEESSSEPGGINAKLEEYRKEVEAANQRWKVLQGMINKKDEEIGAMRELLADFAKQQTQPQQAPKAEQAEVPAELFSKDDVAEYGDDLVNFVSKVASNAAAQALARYRGEAESKFGQIEGSVKNMQQATAKTAQEMFFASLTEAVPDWRTLNSDESFLQWLDQADQFTGATKLDLLQHAVQNHDVARAARFFTVYKGDTGQQTTAPAASAAKDKFVAPGKTKAPAPKQDAKRTWSRAEIAKLYDDKMAGRVTAKEFDRLERDIFAAQRDGRIAA